MCFLTATLRVQTCNMRCNHQRHKLMIAVIAPMFATAIIKRANTDGYDQFLYWCVYVYRVMLMSLFTVCCFVCAWSSITTSLIPFFELPTVKSPWHSVVYCLALSPQSSEVVGLIPHDFAWPSCASLGSLYILSKHA